jgi:hypothetical protein
VNRSQMRMTAIAIYVLASSCSDRPAGRAAAPMASEEAVRAFGHGPSADGAAVYQPDVVIIEGGPAAIRGASSNGLMWKVDAGAGGAAGLKVGVVMFATSRAVGRVAAIVDDGDTRIVTLAPVTFTEVVRDATIDLDQDLDPSAAQFQHLPGLPGASDPVVQSPAPGVVLPPALSIVAPSPFAPTVVSWESLPPASSSSIEVKVGDWTIKPYAQLAGKPLGGGPAPPSTTSKFGAQVTRSTMLKLMADLAFTFKKLRVRTGATVAGGAMTRTDYLIEGIDGFEVSFNAGIAGRGTENGKFLLSLPVTINWPVPPSPATSGLPLDAQLSITLSVATALTGKNSTLLASGRWGLSGPIGIEGAALRAPAFKMEKSIIDSISGITIGPSGLVVAVKFKLIVGLGTPAAVAGPYGSLTGAVGVTNGSSLGAFLARCRGATLEVKVGAGFGLAIDSSIKEKLAEILPTWAPKLDVGLEASVVKRQQTIPDVPLCTGLFTSK